MKSKSMKHISYFIVLICIIVAGCSNPIDESYKEKYEKLVASLKSSRMNNSIDDYRKPASMFDWSSTNSNSIILKNVVIGEIKHHCIGWNDYNARVQKDSLVISNGETIVLHPFGSYGSFGCDGEFVEFIYRGLKYFVYVCQSCKHEIFGARSSIDDNFIYSCMGIEGGKVFWSNSFMKYQIYIKKWELDEMIYLMVFRDDSNCPVLKFMKEDNK